MSYLILRDNVIVAKCDYMCKEAVDAATLTVVPPELDVFVSAKGELLLVDVGTTPLPEGYSDARSEDFALGKLPDGKGGWILPPPLPTPDATAVPKWKLSAALAAKGVSFTPADATIAARWQHEPSFAIDGAVATALKASLGYDASQLQALFNEAAALT